MSQEIKTNDDSRHTVSKLHKEKIFRTVLSQILGKKSSMTPQRNRPRILNINYLDNDTSYKSSVSKEHKMDQLPLHIHQK